MSRIPLPNLRVCGSFILLSIPHLLMAETNETAAARWLANAPAVPPFAVPASLEAWQAKRKGIRSEVWELLGKLPPRPTIPKVETLSRDDRDGYVVSCFSMEIATALHLWTGSMRLKPR